MGGRCKIKGRGGTWQNYLFSASFFLMSSIWIIYFLFRLIWGRFLGRFLFEFLPIVCGVQNAVVEIVFFVNFVTIRFLGGGSWFRKKQRTCVFVSLCESICDREEREGKKKKQTTIYNQLLLTAAEFQKNTQFYWNLRFYIRTSLPFFLVLTVCVWHILRLVGFFWGFFLLTLITRILQKKSNGTAR